MTEGQLELLRAELQRRDARIMEVEDELDRSHRSLEGPRRVSAALHPFCVGLGPPPPADHCLAPPATTACVGPVLQTLDLRPPTAPPCPPHRCQPQTSLGPPCRQRRSTSSPWKRSRGRPMRWPWHRATTPLPCGNPCRAQFFCHMWVVCVSELTHQLLGHGRRRRWPE